MLHGIIPLGDIHRAINWLVADAAARTALSPGLVTSDIGKICLQVDTATPYMLLNLTPTWIPMGGGSTFINPMTAVKDIIVGGALSGGVATPVRLAKGGLRQVLRVNYANNDLEYGDDSTVSVIAAPVSGTITLDCSLGDYFTHTLSANITGWTISNLLGAGRGNSKLIRITQDAVTPRTVAWPASFRWEGAA